MGHRLGPLAAPLRAVSASVTAVLDRIRPSPMADGPLLGVVLLVGLAALSAAGLVGLALAGWAATSADDVVPAVASAAIVGALFLGLFHLVFASKRRRGAGRADG
ncbi:hypothetical protein [Actinorugispora endophytica]|uniref:hypothetical protein n=1 Tax=Actinorugispora endophytica TaxID=1605990 RepID=UPI00105B26D7|nr:hypothetical protein [Actinorugispora endophytica]